MNTPNEQNLDKQNLDKQKLADQNDDQDSAMLIMINSMFDPEHFRQHGHALIDVLADQLKHQLAGNGKVIDWQDPATEDLHWQQPLPHQPTLDAAGLLNSLKHTILANGLAIHHPHNLGHQVATPLPMAALCDLVAALSNQAMAVYETGPSATMLERQVIRWLCKLIGWGTDAADGIGSREPGDQEAEAARTDNKQTQAKTTRADGVLTSGGAQANLTALLAARQRSAHWDVWKDGVAATQVPVLSTQSQQVRSAQNQQAQNDQYQEEHIAKQQPACLRILASEHAHYSVSRAAGIMGLGTEAVIKVATDQHGGMDINALMQAHQDCLKQGQLVMAVVATAGCTPTGSIDPLLDIGRYCNAHNIWLHVDGAHGASALMSSRHRDQLQGIALADSVVWDGHKLLYMPATVSAVLFRQAKNSYAAFAQDASYLFHDNNSDDNEHTQAYNTSYRTLECTKRMMALKLWAAFSLYGVTGMATLVDTAFSKAKLFASKLAAHPAFELLMQPQTNIVCFRHMNVSKNSSVKANGLEPLNIENMTQEEMNQHQVRLRQAIVQSGAFHLTQVELHGHIWLRTTLMNPFTSAEDLDQLLALIVSLAD